MDVGVMRDMMQSMPVAEMYGVDAGPSETHYGNNMPMTAGSECTITGTLNGQVATLRCAPLPRSGVREAVTDAGTASRTQGREGLSFVVLRRPRVDGGCCQARDCCER